MRGAADDHEMPKICRIPGLCAPVARRLSARRTRVFLYQSVAKRVPRSLFDCCFLARPAVPITRVENLIDDAAFDGERLEELPPAPQAFALRPRRAA